MPKTRVTEEDLGWTAILREIDKAKSARVHVGIMEGEAERDDDSEIDNVALGIIHEYGRGNNPERSFMRSTFDEDRRGLIRLKDRLWSQVLRGRLTTNQALELMGQEHQEAVQAKIVALKDPPIEKETERRRKFGGTNPLVDTSDFYRSITYQLVG